MATRVHYVYTVVGKVQKLAVWDRSRMLEGSRCYCHRIVLRRQAEEEEEDLGTRHHGPHCRVEGGKRSQLEVRRHYP